MNSSKYQSVTTNALTLIATINKAQQDFDKLLNQANDLGITLKQGDAESNTAYLGRIAAEATEKRRDCLKQEDMKRIEW
jgi:ABC-type transporter Mla subunit MlaD